MLGQLWDAAGGAAAARAWFDLGFAFGGEYAFAVSIRAAKSFGDGAKI